MSRVLSESAGGWGTAGECLRWIMGKRFYLIRGCNLYCLVKSHGNPFEVNIRVANLTLYISGGKSNQESWKD